LVHILLLVGLLLLLIGVLKARDTAIHAAPSEPDQQTRREPNTRSSDPRRMRADREQR
jgi:hypothetical protein